MTRSERSFQFLHLIFQIVYSKIEDEFIIIDCSNFLSPFTGNDNIVCTTWHSGIIDQITAIECMRSDFLDDSLLIHIYLK